ncbi:MAG: amidohydrolase family protein [Kiloniellales bacterium]
MVPRRALAGLAVGAWVILGLEAASAGSRYIDTHMHLHPQGLDAVMAPGGRRPFAGGGPGDEAASLATAADNLVIKMDRQGVEKALIVTVPAGRQSGEAVYRAMREAVRGHPGRLFLMAGGAILGPMIQETDPDHVPAALQRRFEARAEELLEDGAKGFGEMISYHLCMAEGHSFQVAPADHPLFLTLADIAARRDVPIDIHMEAVETPVRTPDNLLRACRANPRVIEPTIAALERLLGHNRKARIVWQHIGWDNVGQMRLGLLRRLLDRHPNLYLALRVEARVGQVGGGGPMPNRIVDQQMRIHRDWRTFITDYQDRLMIGADEFIGPVERRRKRAQSFSETWSILAQLPPPVAAKIGRDNAARVYRLD